MKSVQFTETRVHVGDLRLGMHVTRLDRDWLETGFLLQGFTIRHADELRALQDTCEYVYVEGQVELAHQAGRNRPVQRVRYINKIDVEEELPRAAGHFEDARTLARGIIESVRLGRVLDINSAQRVVNRCVDSILRNDQALLWLVQIKHKDDYTAEHSMNVCILAAAFGKHLGLLRGEIEQLALCGLLHDVGKIRVPDEVLNKPGALTPEEFAVMRRHPTYGRNLLMSVPGMPAVAVDVAFSHHEREDGKGYPRGLGARNIPHFAKIIAIVDTYDAITSSRCYDSGRSSKSALDIIYRNRDTHFDSDLALAFIQCIGVYPPGALVEMTNGEVGIVLGNDPTNKLKPRVLLVRNADKQPCRERVVDLMRLSPDSSGKPYVIARELANGAYGLDLAVFLERGLKIEAPRPDGGQAVIDPESLQTWFAAQPA